jgi:hypothetical protein
MVRKLVNFAFLDPYIGRIQWGFRESLNPERDRSYRYQNGNSRTRPWLTSFFYRTNPTAGSAKLGNPATTLLLQKSHYCPGE